MYDPLWTLCCRTCIPSLALYCLWWLPGLPIPFGYFGLIQDCWGVLGFVCNKCPAVNEGLNDNYVFALPFDPSILQDYCMTTMLAWPFFPLPCSPLYTVMLVRWVNTVPLSILPSVLLMMPLLIVLVVHLILTFVWFWWQVAGAFPQIIMPLSLRLFSNLCLDQHGLMLCLHLSMHAHPLLGGWFNLCSLTVLDDHSVLRSGYPLLWHLFPSLLSLFLACKYAQEHGHLCTCCCWRLDCLLQVRDEVKGKCLIVYDDCLSETSLALSMIPFWLFSAVFWHLPSGAQQTSCAFGFTTELPSFARIQVDVLSVILLAVPVLFIVKFFTLYRNIFSPCSWKNHVFFDKSFCIQGHKTHGLLLGQFLFMGTKNDLLNCLHYI